MYVNLILNLCKIINYKSFILHDIRTENSIPTSLLYLYHRLHLHTIYSHTQKFDDEKLNFFIGRSSNIYVTKF